MPNVIRAKCVILGDSAVGKSALVQAFGTESSTFHKNYSMTCTVDIRTKCVSVPDTEDLVEVLLLDSSGKDIYSGVLSQMWHHLSMVCIVFDVTNENSFNSCSQWLDSVKNSNDFNCPGVLVGNKADLKERRTVSGKVAQEFAYRNGLQYFESSVKDAQGVEEPFFYLVNEWHKIYMEKTEFFKTLS